MKSTTKSATFEGMGLASYSVNTRFGQIIPSWNAQGLLKSIRWEHDVRPKRSRFALHPFWKNWIEDLEGFFETGRALDPLPWDKVDTEGWTEFQTKVYQSITRIPHGETRTYAWVAARVGNHSACRAVGQALRKNPVLILIPCHRVISSQGGFGGFMGKRDPGEPEMEFKRRLIELEQNFKNPLFPFVQDFLDQVKRKPAKAEGLTLEAEIPKLVSSATA